MEATVNGVKVSADSEAAVRIAAVRELLLQEARSKGLAGGDDAMIEGLIEGEVQVPEPAEAECRRLYVAQPERWSSGELVEACHILFAVTPGANVEVLRQKAESVLHAVKREPDSFADQAKACSNCPSAELGGNLGQLAKGDCVPEFWSALAGQREPGIVPRLVNTRFGFHIVRLEHRVEGRELPFEAVRERIAAELVARAWQQAARHYVSVLAGKAQVCDVDLGAAHSPLLQ
jgi:peptidyl-prolyl cis-trans isomerase C